MKTSLVLIALSSIASICRADKDWLKQYSVIWTSPSKDSYESMPAGGNSIGLNVQIEDGDVLFYPQRRSSFTEHNKYHKLTFFSSPSGLSSKQVYTSFLAITFEIIIENFNEM